MSWTRREPSEETWTPLSASPETWARRGALSEVWFPPLPAGMVFLIDGEGAFLLDRGVFVVAADG